MYLGKMATRKAPENDDENPTKRQRVDDELDKEFETDIASFDDLNEDCLVKILSYLVTEDMNSVACLNSHCQQARSNESLDQTRTGTIVCSERTSIPSLYNAIITGGWNNIFSGNRTHLRIENIASTRLEPLFDPALAGDAVSHRARLAGVTSIDLSCNPESSARRQVHSYIHISAFFRILPNHREIDLSHVRVQWGYLYAVLGYRCPHLTRITGTSSAGWLYIGGLGSPNRAQNLTELYLDGCRLVSTAADRSLYESTTPINDFLFCDCGSLERLSLKGATCGENEDSQVISQQMLLKMARRHRALRWLKSDLSEENTEILKRERPEITFVS